MQSHRALAPIFRWAGSKRKLLPTLLECAPINFTRYIEPFAGSACLFFAMRPKQAILGDINDELLRTYETVRSHPRLVARAAHAIEISSLKYYRVRKQDPSKLEAIERAARFIYLNRFCFNGVYRTNKKGFFNVPRGKNTGSIQDESVFLKYSIALRSAKLAFGDFENCLDDLQSTDFVYLDPPYASTGSRASGEYGYGCFGIADIPRLIAALEKIQAAGATFLLSYSYSLELNELLARWSRIQLSVRRHVAGFARDRGQVTELLVSNRELADIKIKNREGFQ